MATVVCTGSCGFIGSHLVEALLSRGDTVRVIDDFSEGKPENLPEHASLRIYRRSILDDNADLFQGVDTVYHLAAMPRPQYSVNYPLITHQVNVDGTLNVLLAARDAGVKRLVFASSASVYGHQTNFPTAEIDPPHPMTPYSVHKVIGEYYCKLFSELYNLQTVALRFFNVYGPRQNPGGEYASLIPKFIKLIAADERPTIYGTGEQERDFVHVSDVVRALVLAGDSDITGEIINVGSGDSYQVHTIFETICKVLGKFPLPLYGPAQVEPQRTMADTWRAQRLLGWKPLVDIEDGIRGML